MVLDNVSGAVRILSTIAATDSLSLDTEQTIDGLTAPTRFSVVVTDDQAGTAYSATSSRFGLNLPPARERIGYYYLDPNRGTAGYYQTSSRDGGRNWDQPTGISVTLPPPARSSPPIAMPAALAFSLATLIRNKLHS